MTCSRVRAQQETTLERMNRATELGRVQRWLLPRAERWSDYPVGRPLRTHDPRKVEVSFQGRKLEGFIDHGWVEYPKLKSAKLIPHPDRALRYGGVTFTFIKHPPSAAEFIAFRHPTAEEEFFGKVLHCNCERVSGYYRGIKCYACIYEGWNHDPGDEQPETGMRGRTWTFDCSGLSS